jgi:hypothetical protein
MMGSIQPKNWDPMNPPEKVCIFCYDHAERLVVWKYGVNWVCYEGKCKNRAKEMVGFAGIFPLDKKRDAEATFSTQELARREKAARGR